VEALGVVAALYVAFAGAAALSGGDEGPMATTASIPASRSTTRRPSATRRRHSEVLDEQAGARPTRRFRRLQRRESVEK